MSYIFKVSKTWMPQIVLLEMELYLHSRWATSYKHRQSLDSSLTNRCRQAFWNYGTLFNLISFDNRIMSKIIHFFPTLKDNSYSKRGSCRVNFERQSARPHPYINKMAVHELLFEYWKICFVNKQTIESHSRLKRNYWLGFVISCPVIDIQYTHY